MPQKSKKQSKTQAARSSRLDGEGESERQDEGSSSSEEEEEEEEVASTMDIDYVEEEEDEGEGEDGEKIFKYKLDLSMIGDLFEMCKSSCGSRNLSVLIYTILRHLDLTWRRTDDLLRSIGAYRCESAHKWTEIFMSGDISKYFRRKVEEVNIMKHSTTYSQNSRQKLNFSLSNLAHVSQPILQLLTWRTSLIASSTN
jgi:hypothetical protein